MAWIEFHTALRDHWKIHRLAESLGVSYPQALGSISLLWLWLVTNAPDGNVTLFTDAELARAAQLSPQIPVKKVLQDCELLDQNGRVHDWSKHGLKFLKSQKLRVKKHRERKRDSNVTVTDQGNVTVTATLPNHTIPNLTEGERETRTREYCPPPFSKPTLAEVKAYCLERLSPVDPDHWYAHYEANGWKVGTNPMLDWQAAVRSWETNKIENGKNEGQQTDWSEHNRRVEEEIRNARAAGHVKR